MLKYSTLLFLLLLTPKIHAQSPGYDDLLVMYVDEDYEKCIKKADRYIGKEDTRRDPLPYLYASMCYHEMSKQDKYAEHPEFKNAARDALKYAVKFRKKDVHNAYAPNYADFWSELNTTAMDYGFMLMETGSFSKAKRQFDRITRYQPENPGAWLMLVQSQKKMNLRRDALESMQQFRKAYAAVPDLSRLPLDQQRLLREALLRHARRLDPAGMRDSALATMKMGGPQFLDNAEFRAFFEELQQPVRQVNAP